MEKCDMCRDLLANGEKPACVAACTMRCLEIGEYSNLESVYGVHTPVPLPDSSQTKPSLIVVPHRFAKADAHLISMPEESVASDQL
jgi:anaerobic dimethyl sulfoxide reductase subunit B (iron-sulfur subunit)